MPRSTVSVPIPTALFLDLSMRLLKRGDRTDPVEVIQTLVSGWINRDDSNSQLPSPPQEIGRNLDSTGKKGDGGYWWKNIYIPDGSLARMTYRGRGYIATVTSNGFEYDGLYYSPSEFTYKITNTSRNAWRDIELKFPAAPGWVPADVYRKTYSEP